MNTPSQPTGFKRFLSGRWRRTGLAALAAGAFTLGACSFGGGHHGDGHYGSWSGGPIDPEKAARYAEKMADRIVSATDGTPEQKQKIQTIAQSAIADLAPMREQFGSARREAMTLLGAATVDRGAMEALRAKQIGLADSASKRLTQALADTAEVLTPEQRARLAERMQRKGRWG